MPRIIIKAGETYGKIRVIEVDSPKGEHKNKTFLCECLLCGQKFVSCGQDILKNQDIGCIPCRTAARIKKRENEIRDYIGNVYGSLEIVDFDEFRDSHDSKGKIFLEAWVKCRCKKCGEITSITLHRLKSNGVNQCRKCAEKNLEIGRKISKAESVEGTKISAIDGRRRINKNSSTGYTGVNYHNVTGKYRAYINFKRKQYYLGLYDTLDSAVAARKEAEKRIYGDFLKWYQEKHPEQWKKLRKRERNA